MVQWIRTSVSAAVLLSLASCVGIAGVEEETSPAPPTPDFQAGSEATVSSHPRLVLERAWSQEEICGQPHLIPGHTQFILERCDGGNEVRDARTGASLRRLPDGAVWMVSADWVSIYSGEQVVLLDARNWRRQRIDPEPETVARAVPFLSAPDGRSAVGLNGRGVFEWRLDRGSPQFGQRIAWDQADRTSYSTGVIAYAPDSSFLLRIVWRAGQQRLVLGARLSGQDALVAPLSEAVVSSLVVGSRGDIAATLNSEGVVTIFSLATTDAPLPIEIHPTASFETGMRLRFAATHFMQFVGDEMLLIGDEAGEIGAWSLDGSLVWRRRVGAFFSAPVVDLQHDVLVFLAGNALQAMDLTTGDAIILAADAFETAAVSVNGFAVTTAAQPKGASHEIAMPMRGWRIRYQN